MLIDMRPMNKYKMIIRPSADLSKRLRSVYLDHADAHQFGGAKMTLESMLSSFLLAYLERTTLRDRDADLLKYLPVLDAGVDAVYREAGVPRRHRGAKKPKSADAGNGPANTPTGGRSRGTNFEPRTEREIGSAGRRKAK